MKAFLISVLLLALVALLYLFRPFLLSIAIAALLAIATANLAAALARKIKRPFARALILSLCVALLFLAPFGYAAMALASGIKSLDISVILAISAKLKSLQLPESLAFLQPTIDGFLAEQNIANAAKSALNYASNFSGKGLKFFTDLILIIIFYFFAHYYGAQLLHYLRALLPLAKDQWSSLLKQLSGVMSVVFYSVIITAVFEGFLFAFIAKIYGYDALLWGILYAIGSLIPVIGGALLWVPLAALSYARIDASAAIIIAVYSVVVISGIADTLIKPLIIRAINEKLLKVQTNVNELLIFFSMVAGIGTFGFWGVILGPAILAFFTAWVKLFSEFNWRG